MNYNYGLWFFVYLFSQRVQPFLKIYFIIFPICKIVYSPPPKKSSSKNTPLKKTTTQKQTKELKQNS